jgi:hypothetical protein
VTLSAAQLQKIWLLSDTVLYPEAVSFLHKLVREQECDPLPPSQVAGLLSIADSHKYDELYRYVVHQRERDWPPARRDLKTFYTAFEQVLSLMHRKRLREEFHLLTAGNEGSGRSVSDIRQEADELMAVLAREFIQHLLAENGVLAAQKAEERARQKSSRR